MKKPVKLQMLQMNYSGRATAEPTGELRAVLVPWRRRLQLRRGILWLTRGLLLGMVPVAAALAAARLSTVLVEPAPVFAMAGLLLACLACLLYWLATAPKWKQVAELVDRAAGLDDRMVTALDFAADTRPVAILQRNDALKRLAEQEPGVVFPLQLPRRELFALPIMVVFVALLLFTPNAMVVQLANERATAAAIQQAEHKIERLQQETTQVNLTPEQKTAIQKTLDEAQQKLAEAKTPEAAVAALSKAEADIQQLRDPQAAAKERSRQALAAALASDPGTQDLAQAIASGDQAQIDAALKALADRMEKMSPEERRQLAQQLQRAANAARDQPDVSNQLRQAARAMENGNTAEASDELTQLGSDLKQANQASQQEATLAQVQQDVQSVRSDTVAATNGDQQQAQTQNQQGQQQNQGQAQGQGQNQGQQAADGQGQGQGQQQGQGQGSNGSGAGTGQGQGNANQNTDAAKASENVYVPGQQGQGPVQQQNGGSSDSSGTVTPYREVIGSYSQNARDTIDRSNIPPNLRENVRRYFSDLEK